MGYTTIIIELKDENEVLKRQNQLLETRNKLKQIEHGKQTCGASASNQPNCNGKYGKSTA